MSRRKIRDEADARACLEAAHASGTPRAAWARAHGIDARSLQAWRLILERMDTAQQPVEFLELVPTLPPARAPRPLRLVHEGLLVEVPEDFDDDHLLRVLRVVLAC